MKLKIGIIILLLGLIACNTQPEKNREQEQTNGHPDSHMSKNSLDWAGVYSGTMPCADCGGIKTEIELNDNSTYTLTTQYLGNSDRIYRESGNFEWNDAGKAISLQGANERPEFHQYKVVENALVKLDKNGEPIESALSEMYRLQKDQE